MVQSVKPLTKTYTAIGSPVPSPNGAPTVGLTDVSGSCDSVSQLSYQPILLSNNHSPTLNQSYTIRSCRSFSSSDSSESESLSHLSPFCGFSGFSTVE